MNVDQQVFYDGNRPITLYFLLKVSRGDLYLEDIYHDRSFRIQANKERCLPILTIGQMIEFLDDKIPLYIVQLISGWIIEEDSINIRTELCDSLWEATKSILNKEV